MPRRPRSRPRLDAVFALAGALLATTLCVPAYAGDPDPDVWIKTSDNPPKWIARTPNQRSSSKWNGLTFGVSVGGLWGGTYASERYLTDDADLQLIYEDGHSEPVDFTIWSGGLFAAYEYGPEALRLQATLLARLDTQAYSAGSENYEPLSGSGMLSSRYALLIGPALTLLSGAQGSLDAGLGVGGVLGSYRPAAGLLDSVAEVAGEMSVTRPSSERLTGVGGRAWLSAMFWAQDRSFGIGIGLYYDLSWMRADLPPPWPHVWFDQSFGVMFPVATRF